MDFWGSAHPHRFWSGRTRAGAGIKKRGIEPQKRKVYEKDFKRP